MRQVAWLNATPEESKPSNSKKERPQPVSRRVRLERDGINLSMPPLEFGGQYLIDYLFEIGPTSAAGMGPAPLAWAEIQAWQQQMGIDLQPWQCRLLRSLSCEYIAEGHEARNPARPPPYGAMPRNPRLSKKLDAFLD